MIYSSKIMFFSYKIMIYSNKIMFFSYKIMIYSNKIMFFSYKIMIYSYKIMIYSYKIMMYSNKIMFYSYKIRFFSYQIMIYSYKEMIYSNKIMFFSYKIMIYSNKIMIYSYKIMIYLYKIMICSLYIQQIHVGYWTFWTLSLFRFPYHYTSHFLWTVIDTLHSVGLADFYRSRICKIWEVPFRISENLILNGHKLVKPFYGPNCVWLEIGHDEDQKNRLVTKWKNSPKNSPVLGAFVPFSKASP